MAFWHPGLKVALWLGRSVLCLLCFGMWGLLEAPSQTQTPGKSCGSNTPSCDLFGFSFLGLGFRVSPTPQAVTCMSQNSYWHIDAPRGANTGGTSTKNFHQQHLCTNYARSISHEVLVPQDTTRTKQTNKPQNKQRSANQSSWGRSSTNATVG